jgi:hypothetical protein
MREGDFKQNPRVRVSLDQVYFSITRDMSLFSVFVTCSDFPYVILECGYKGTEDKICHVVAR